MTDTTPPSRAEASRRLGRRIGLIVFGVLTSAFTLVCSAQIVKQVWFPELPAAEPACKPGIERLIGAVERARRAAAAENGDERAALARFRTMLSPEWQERASLEEACKDDADTRQALRDVVELRYAEEHAVRYEAVALARLRRRVQALDPSLGKPESR
jgi:hypothetical protein